LYPGAGTVVKAPRKAVPYRGEGGAPSFHVQLTYATLLHARNASGSDKHAVTSHQCVEGATPATDWVVKVLKQKLQVRHWHEGTHDRFMDELRS
jgi:hypothetical protein